MSLSPALSTAIRTLETELGLVVVERGRRFVGFTEEGERVLGWARQTLAALQHMRHDASAAQSQLVGTLRVGVIPTVMPVSARVLGPCMHEHPGIRYEVHSLSSDAILRQLDEYELDLGLTYLDDRVQAGFNVLPLYTERYILLSPDEGRGRFDTGAACWRELGALPFGFLASTMQNRAGHQRGIPPRKHTTPKPCSKTDSLLAIYGHVIHAGLFAILPHSVLSVLSQGSGVRTSRLPARDDARHRPHHPRSGRGRALGRGHLAPCARAGSARASSTPCSRA
ncbi:MAG: LysR family transcriptional regulator [Pararobbsia sp.]